MQEYPKIETLYDRNERTHTVIVDRVRYQEFLNIHRWIAYEKIDGTNVRVLYRPDRTIQFGGRTDNAQMPVVLAEYLRMTFTPEKLSGVFEGDSEVMLFGEGYGGKIQSGGHYRTGVSFRLFDVLVGSWWLEPHSLMDIALKLGISLVPYLGTIQQLPKTVEDLEYIIGPEGSSHVAYEDRGPGLRAEGIVARTVPLLFTRKGERVMWKLKFRDF